MSWRRAALRGVKVVAAAADLVRRPASGVVVLAYHRVGGGSGLEINLAPDVFEAQCRALAEADNVVSLGDALAHLASGASVPGGEVVLTFDDGTADLVDHAIPTLVRHGLPATIYVATDFIERGVPFPNDGAPISWAALRDAASTGLVSVGSHTHTHLLLDRVDRATVRDELDRSIELIGANVGAAPLDFAYPKAVLGSADAREEVAARFRSAAVAGMRANPYGGTDPQLLQRTPIQVADGVRWFERKASGGMALEDELRRRLNGRRYSGAVS